MVAASWAIDSEFSSDIDREQRQRVLGEIVAENGDFRQVPLQAGGCLGVLKAQLGQANSQLILKKQNRFGLGSAHTEVQRGSNYPLAVWMQRGVALPQETPAAERLPAISPGRAKAE